ncbi:alpha/beta hydrolase-fold protein [Candidatus Latescibacterota bacterium]
MRHAIFTVIILFVFCTGVCFGQAADGVPASTNVSNGEYPRIDDQLRASFRVNAPDAQSIRISLGGGTDLVKGDDGIWTGTTVPLVPGFHYYDLIINGVAVSDPASESYFGASRMWSAIEVPAPDQDFYMPQDVPRGQTRMLFYDSEMTGTTRRYFVYTPPGYDTDTSTRYPVLFLLHGGGEDDRGWAIQGRTNFIMDNMIAEKSCVPMIVVMENTYSGPSAGGGLRSMRSSGAAIDNLGIPFYTRVVNEVIPMIDSTFRTKADRDYRAMAGLSMGALYTYQTTLNNLDYFSHIGAFSGGIRFGVVTEDDLKGIFNGVFADADEFNRRVPLLWIGVGSEEGQHLNTLSQTMNKIGIKTTYYESQGTAHEWLTWRRCLHEFAPLLFKK